MIVVLCVFIWWLIGFLYTSYMQHLDEDIMVDSLPELFMCGVFGPIVIFVHIVFILLNSKTVIIKKKKVV